MPRLARSISLAHLSELFEDQRLEERGVESVAQGERPRVKRSVEQELANRGRKGNLGLHALLDDIPNLGNPCHDGGAELLQRTDGVRSGGRERLGVGVADRATVADHCELKIDLKLNEIELN